MHIVQPPDWSTPSGYANGVAAEGRVVFVAGQVGWDERGQFQTDDFVAQARQALQGSVLGAGEFVGALGPEQVGAGGRSDDQ